MCPCDQQYFGLHEEEYDQQVLILCCALVRPHMEYCIQFWDTVHNRDRELLETVQQRVAKMMRDQEHLRKLGLLSKD